MTPDATTLYKVTITTIPPGTAVFVNDASHGPSPVTLSLAPGSRLRLRGVKNGFADATSEVTVDHDAQDFALTLTPVPTTAVKPPQKTIKTTKPATGRADKGSNAKPSSFDPNEVGGD